ncbi:pirin family protein [Rhizobium sp. 60-20]|uniref:pirin family protein n=1 Tax=Rhizobium sp. 60-20 TaxID=1895819 RepID=UPI000928E0AB|nr:pirin family protein [Rhizobium sp. 60-20]MBN8949872.1 pirin family protein [Rhizobium tropici]OJY62749.1 MAG: hypothetical protein BGP09_16840 [Rhizobium sp. 60-20]
MTYTKIGEVVCGEQATVGTGFSATRFRHTGFTTNVSPFVLVDHYHMRARTFGPHPHAGFSSVTLAFEDCVGEVVSRDSVGHKASIRAGDLHWTLAGSGIVHSQEPEAEGVSFHGLQIFVNLPERLKLARPASWLLPADRIPTMQERGAIVRVVAGSYKGLQSPAELPQPLTVLDAGLAPDATLVVPLPKDWNAIVIAISGTTMIDASAECTLAAGEAVSLSSTQVDGDFQLRALDRARVVVLAAAAIQEPVMEHGPFIGNAQDQLALYEACFRRGEFGAIA